MNLKDIAKANADRTPDVARNLMLHSVAGDIEALEELDRDYEIWPRVNLAKLGALISGIYADKALQDDDISYQYALREKRERLGIMIEQVWGPAILGWADTRIMEANERAQD